MRILPKRNGITLPNQHEARLRIVVILGTMLLAVLIGLRPGSRLAMLPGLAVLGLLGLVVLLRYLPWGVIALVPIAFLVDFKIGTGTNVAFNATFLFVMVLIGVWLLRMVVIERQVRLIPSPVNLPALLFIGAGLLSWLASFLPWLPMASSRPSLPAQAGAFLIYALSMGAMLLAVNQLSSIRLIKIFTWTYLAFGVVYLSTTMVATGTKYVYQWFVDAQYGQSVFWTLLAALAVGQALFNRGLRLPLRIGLLATAGLEIGYVLIFRPNWISGWLPPLIAVAVLIWLWDWRAGIALSLAGIIAIPVINNFMANQVNDSVQQWSTYSRFATWPIVYELFKANPLTGLGPANYSFFTAIYPLVGYYLKFNSHNNYFDILLQMGLLGLGIFAWLMIGIWRSGWKLRRRASEPFACAYACSMLASMVAILFSGALADWFLPFVYNIGISGFQGSVFFWLFCGGLVSLYHIESKEPSRQEFNDGLKS